MRDEDGAALERRRLINSTVLAVGTACLLFVLTGWVTTTLKAWLGLNSLELGAWVDLLLTCSNGLFLCALSPHVRAACINGAQSISSRSILPWGAAVVAGNVVLLGLALRFNPGHTADVGWTHYFGLPAGQRPAFLLHYLLVSGFISCVAAPVVEELLHAGVIIGSLRRAGLARPLIYGINALLFALLHQAFSRSWIGWTLFLSLAAGRAFLDYLFYRTNNIAIPILAHALHNLRVTIVTVSALV